MRRGVCFVSPEADSSARAFRSQAPGRKLDESLERLDVDDVAGRDVAHRGR